MKNLKNQITANTVDEVKNQVEQLFRSYGYIVFDTVEEIEDFYNENYEYEPGTELSEETVEAFTVPGEMSGDWETEIKVTIKAYYKDSGSVDYCYIVKVEEN